MKYLAIISFVFSSFNLSASERDAILKDVKTVACPGVPGPLCVFGDGAFALVMAGPEPVVAASTAKGRVVAFGHELYFSEPTLKVGDTGTLLINSIRWAANVPNGITVITRGAPNLGHGLKDKGFSVLNEPRGKDWLPAKSEGVVVVVNPARIDDDDAKALLKHLENGGGLIAGMPGWGWRQTHPGKKLDRDLPINRILAAAGIAFADDTVNKPQNGLFSVAPVSEYTNSETAIKKIESWLSGGDAPNAADAEMMRAAIQRLSGSAPAESAAPLQSRLEKSLAAANQKIPLPSPGKPLTQARGAERLLLTLSMRNATKAHPASAAFPGSVPESAERISRMVHLNITSKGTICNGVGTSAKSELWHSTGLYAAPGETIQITVPAGTVNKFGVRIGAHTDTLWHQKSWQRAPDISLRKPIDNATITAMNPFGGLIYITAPPGLELGEIRVMFKNAIEAPLFVGGKTTPEEWTRMKKLEAPWAEIASGKIIFTIPTSLARTVEDPAEVLAFWDKVMDAQADLTMLPRERGRAERLVHDVQISAGYMHSGYPIMGPLNEAMRAMDIKSILREGAWGYFHELGHNHQQKEWTFDGTVEVTCNLYSLYCHEKLCPDAPLHESIRPDAVRKHAEAYRKGGAKFETWKQEPFTALIMYQQMKDSFGWETYQKVFKLYQEKKLRPVSEEAKRDEWMVRMSELSGKNLAPFFESWGVPVSAAAKAKVNMLPKWEPAP